MASAVFYPLTVSAVDRLAEDAVAVTFDVPASLREVFAFQPGQSLTVRRGDERRSYSICAPPGRAPRIGVREVPGERSPAGWSTMSGRATWSRFSRRPARSPRTCPGPGATC